MAGDWIKIQHALPDKPEVVQMAADLGIDQDAVVGKLIRLWVWADQQCAIGDALSVTESFLDRITFVTGFAAALRSVGWLTGNNKDLTLPNFERHNGKTAKTRGNSQKRMESLRSRDAASVTKSEQDGTKSVTREEKSIKEENTNKPISASASPLLPTATEVVSAFNEAFGTRVRMTTKRQEHLRARQRDEYWRDNWREALEVGGRSSFLKGDNDRGWSINLEFFLKPDTVTNILEGKYNNNGKARNSEQEREQSNADAFDVVFGNRNSTGDRAALLDEADGEIHAAPVRDMGDCSGLF